jgi:DNA-binding transcriptional LysR family regulator
MKTCVRTALEADIRRRLEHPFREAGVCDRLDVVLEIGGWPAMLAYVRRGVGVGIITRSALGKSRQRYVQRLLDPRQFALLVIHLICRGAARASSQVDLALHAVLFAQVMREAVRQEREADGPGS